jgi:predicted 2-oxoglutarate/Fe(II)-dependent dioxygenase YbiX
MFNLITPSGFFGTETKNIVVLNNFLDEEERLFLLDIAKKVDTFDPSTNDTWKDRVAGVAVLDSIDKRATQTIMQIQQRLKPIIERHFNCTVTATGPSIVKWIPGHVQPPHADKEEWQEPNVGKPNHSPHYDIGNIIYLNDDYEGGELYFPQHDLQFKPENGTAAFFPGDRNYLHGVTEITSGIRYTLPTFWTITEHHDSTNQ